MILSAMVSRLPYIHAKKVGCDIRAKPAWFRGIIPASGWVAPTECAGGPEFDSRSRPIFLVFWQLGALRPPGSWSGSNILRHSSGHTWPQFWIHKNKHVSSFHKTVCLPCMEFVA